MPWAPLSDCARIFIINMSSLSPNAEFRVSGYGYNGEALRMGEM
jgi:hypothetical protein